MKILIDADACPRQVLQVCIRMGREQGIAVWTVASFAHDILSDHPIQVGNDPQEADLKIMNLAEPGDVVVTQDRGLAAVVLGKGARAMSPAGREFGANRIAFLLEERELKARARRAGRRTRGPKKREAADDRRFEACLKTVLGRKGGGADEGDEAVDGRT
jgi:uncharacterized protein YaiI (UPF0178 family)